MFCDSMSKEDLYSTHQLARNVANGITTRDNIIKAQHIEINDSHNELIKVYLLINEFKSEFEQCEDSRDLFTMVDDFIRKIDDLILTS